MLFLFLCLPNILQKTFYMFSLTINIYTYIYIWSDIWSRMCPKPCPKPCVGTFGQASYLWGPGQNMSKNRVQKHAIFSSLFAQYITEDFLDVFSYNKYIYIYIYIQVYICVDGWMSRFLVVILCCYFCCLFFK